MALQYALLSVLFLIVYVSFIADDRPERMVFLFAMVGNALGATFLYGIWTTKVVMLMLLIAMVFVFITGGDDGSE